ncbi:hypothetical protein Pgy4_09348 [Pseudomonas savastanoi pv. glycinea str. race 4]|uniref:Uncharacterized protein n=1 Tax=Pseudomonas savastanoi pv. glycinea str. race 4 TaxID=875330 RepID=F3C2U4_PSESG|nr:hypothetical protein Pgy4_09348 [Pseudomonas savastanoi pv. glycinea str. race 4]
MSGHDDHAALFTVPGEMVFQLGNALAIQRGERLID